jgi:hypothetical protein
MLPAPATVAFGFPDCGRPMLGTARSAATNSPKRHSQKAASFNLDDVLRRLQQGTHN